MVNKLTLSFEQCKYMEKKYHKQNFKGFLTFLRR